MKKDWLSGIIEKIRTNRRLEFSIYGVLIALALVLYFSSISESASPQENNAGAVISSSSFSSSEQEVEARLEKALKTIRGAGNVNVMITYETGPEIVPAMSIDRQENSSVNDGSMTESQNESSKPATISQSGGNEPIVLTERQPTIRGVIIIAEGAADISVQMDLQRAAQTVLGVSLDCIEVFEMARESS